MRLRSTGRANNTISTNLSSNCAQRLPEPQEDAARHRAGRQDQPRTGRDDILNYNVKNSRGQLVPFSAFATGRPVEEASPWIWEERQR